MPILRNLPELWRYIIPTVLNLTLRNWPPFRSLALFLRGVLLDWAGRFLRTCFKRGMKMKIRSRLKLLVYSFQKVTWWILTSKYKSQMGSAFVQFPGQNVYADFKETSRRLAWLLLEYLRMDLIDGDADSLRRLESWLNAELLRIRKKPAVPN
jgi:hypothetical protein